MSETMIAAQLWTVRENIKTAEDFAAAMKRLRDIGYRAVQPNWPVPFKDAAELRRVLDEYSLTCCSTHYGADALTKDVDRAIADHQTLGCVYPGAGGAPKDARDADGALRWAKQMTAIAPKLKAAGMRFAYHNHSGEFARWGSRTWMEIMFDSAPPEFTFELDLYWVQNAGANPVKWIRRCGGRCPVLHFKDMGIEDGEQADVPVGDGNLDWPEILAAAREAGTRWYVVEEDHPAGGDGFACLEKSLRNLHAMGVK